MNKIQTACAFLISKLYETEPTGGDIHVVTDDGNLRNSDLEWCESYIKERKVENTEIGRLELSILKLLSILSEEDREKLYAFVWEKQII